MIYTPPTNLSRHLSHHAVHHLLCHLVRASNAAETEIVVCLKR